MAGDAVDTRFLRSVAGQTLVHIQSIHLYGLLHRLDRAMTGLALDAGSDMGRVLKKNKIRHRGDFDPLDRLFLIPMILEFLYFRLVRRGNLMTTHAPLNRGNTGYCGPAGIAVAVLAGYLKIAGVNFVAETDGLLSGSRTTVGAQ